MNQQTRIDKSPGLYYGIIGVWLLLVGGMLYATLPLIKESFSQSTALGITVVISTVGFISYFWLNGLKDVFYTMFYHLWLKKHVKLPERGLGLRTFTDWFLPPRVLLVYCTYNDFNADSLIKSMQQDYSNFGVYILDDSTKADYKQAIDEFAATHPAVEVIRRKDRKGFKAGNLNNFLTGAPYDYFVILDSDEIIPPNFIARALDYFAADPTAGTVQANHIATRKATLFQRKFGPGVDSHWPAYQLVKARFGFMSLLGHGAMVSRQCFMAAGGFPMVVAEDICFTIAARLSGYATLFAPDIICEEEYPPDYLAFLIRHCKWVAGNMEFIQKNTRKIMFSDMTWFEKLDIVLFTYSLPLTSLFSLYVVVNAIVFPAIGYSFLYPLWMLVPTAVFLIAPMLNDILSLWSKMSKAKLLSYLSHSMLLYGSMYWPSLRASLMSIFAKAVFNVTPKDATRPRFRDSLRIAKGQLVFAFVLSAVVTLAAKSVLPVVLLVIPALSSLYLVNYHQEAPGRAASTHKVTGRARVVFTGKNEVKEMISV